MRSSLDGFLDRLQRDLEPIFQIADNAASVARGFFESSREPEQPDPGWDAYALFSGSPWIESLSPGARSRAADRLAERVFRRAVHPMRWSSLVHGLVKDEASLANISEKEAQRRLVRAALMEAIRGVPDASDRLSGIGEFSAQRWSSEKEKKILNGVESVLTTQARAAETRPSSSVEDLPDGIRGEQESFCDVLAVISAAEKLSQMESEVVAAVALGSSSAEIGEVLGISASTVRTHLANAREKLAFLNESG